MKSIFKEIDNKVLKNLSKKLETSNTAKDGEWEMDLFTHLKEGKHEIRIRNISNGEKLSVTFFGFKDNKSLIKLGIKALKAKDNFFKKFKGIEYYIKKALRECNKNNPKVVIPYISSAVTYKNGRYYYTKLLDLDRCEIKLGEGVKKKSDFLSYAAKMVKLAENTGTVALSFRANYYLDGMGFIFNKYLNDDE